MSINRIDGPNLKQPRIISAAIRKSAHGQTCAMRSPWCNHDPATVVFCHLPIRRFGFGGMGMKVPDIFGYHGCHQCHAHEADVGWGRPAAGHVRDADAPDPPRPHHGAEMNTHPRASSHQRAVAGACHPLRWPRYLTTHDQEQTP